jgi:hypothetical protein
MPYTTPSSQKRKVLLLLIKDSHTRGSAAEVKNEISGKVEVCGFAKSGSGANILMKSVINEVTNLSKRDVLVF